jgi:hypothetical protein
MANIWKLGSSVDIEPYGEYLDDRRIAFHPMLVEE